MTGQWKGLKKGDQSSGGSLLTLTVEVPFPGERLHPYMQYFEVRDMVFLLYEFVFLRESYFGEKYKKLYRPPMTYLRSHSGTFTMTGQYGFWWWTIPFIFIQALLLSHTFQPIAVKRWKIFSKMNPNLFRLWPIQSWNPFFCKDQINQSYGLSKFEKHEQNPAVKHILVNNITMVRVTGKSVHKKKILVNFLHNTGICFRKFQTSHNLLTFKVFQTWKNMCVAHFG